MKKLKLCDWQYTIKHSIDDFKLGDEVFLKSNPEVKLKVFQLEKDQVLVRWKNIWGGCEHGKFIPESLLKFKYACFVYYANSNFQFCLN